MAGWISPSFSSMIFPDSTISSEISPFAMFDDTGGNDNRGLVDTWEFTGILVIFPQKKHMIE
jgi:hypothetical protein